MPELKEEHFEVIDRNKAKAHEAQKEMRQESLEFIGSCSVYDLQVVYSTIKGIKNKKNES
jgi:hypothetical protein|tara:strand:- start:183 stop:362 length:180 start_codon:yes stop_codon:yes gene_type:complete